VEPGTVNVPTLAEQESAPVRSVDATSGIPQFTTFPLAGKDQEQTFFPIASVSKGIGENVVGTIVLDEDPAFPSSDLTFQLASRPLLSGPLLMGNWLLPPSAPNYLDRVGDGELRITLDSPTVDVSSELGRHSRRTMLIPQTDVLQTAVDQFFARIGNFADHSLEDE
jgi:hypothetical protein